MSCRSEMGLLRLEGGHKTCEVMGSAVERIHTTLSPNWAGKSAQCS